MNKKTNNCIIKSWNGSNKNKFIILILNKYGNREMYNYVEKPAL